MNARSVGSPRTTSRKCVESSRSDCQRLARLLLRVAADQPHEHGHERQRREQDERRRDVDGRDPREHRDRHDAGEHDLRQVAGEVRLEAVHALHRGRRDLGARGAVERDRLRAQPLLDEREPQLGEHVRRARLPATSKPQASTAARGEHDHERTSAVDTASSEAPSKARATTRASSVAWTSTSSAVAMPIATSTPRSVARRACAAEQARVERAHDG